MLIFYSLNTVYARFSQGALYQVNMMSVTHLRVCQLPSAASARSSRRTQPGPQPEKTWDVLKTNSPVLKKEEQQSITKSLK